MSANSVTADEQKIRIAWIPNIREWRDVYECGHGFYWCLDPGDGLPTHIEPGDGIVVIETTEAEADRRMAEFEATLPAEEDGDSLASRLPDSQEIEPQQDTKCSSCDKSIRMRPHAPNTRGHIWEHRHNSSVFCDPSLGFDSSDLASPVPAPAVPQEKREPQRATTLSGHTREELHQHIDNLFEIAIEGEDIPFAALHAWSVKPTPDDIAWAKEQVAAFAAQPPEEPRLATNGHITVNGRVVRHCLDGGATFVVDGGSGPFALPEEVRQIDDIINPKCGCGDRMQSHAHGAGKCEICGCRSFASPEEPRREVELPPLDTTQDDEQGMLACRERQLLAATEALEKAQYHLKNQREQWNNAQKSMADYSNPDICQHCGGVIRKGHTEWFHFDGWIRISRFCEHSGKMATPALLGLKAQHAALEHSAATTLAALNTRSEQFERAIAERDELRTGLEELQANFSILDKCCDEAEADKNAAEAQLASLRERVKELVGLIDNAGLLNLSNGVQLGPTSWYVKTYAALESVRTELTALTPESEEKKS